MTFMSQRIFAFFVILLALAGCAGAPEQTDKLTAGIWLDSLPRQPAVPVRSVNQAALDLTKAFEGWRARLYNDIAHHCTIGYGHLVHLGPCNGDALESDFTAGIDPRRGGELLADDMQRAESAVGRYVKVPLNDFQYGALCDFVFNVGETHFASSTLLVMVNRQDDSGIARQFARWTFANGQENDGLKRRRNAEIAMFFDGRAVPPSTAFAVPEPPIDILVGEGKR